MITKTNGSGDHHRSFPGGIFHLCWSQFAIAFLAVGDGHQPSSRGLYIYQLEEFPIKGGMSLCLKYKEHKLEARIF